LIPYAFSLAKYSYLLYVFWAIKLHFIIIQLVQDSYQGSARLFNGDK
jgi:hypothetical protein